MYWGNPNAGGQFERRGGVRYRSRIRGRMAPGPTYRYNSPGRDGERHKRYRDGNRNRLRCDWNGAVVQRHIEPDPGFRVCERQSELSGHRHLYGVRLGQARMLSTASFTVLCINPTFNTGCRCVLKTMGIFHLYRRNPDWEMSRSPASANSWHALTGVSSGVKQYLYVDGICVDSTRLRLLRRILPG